MRISYHAAAHVLQTVGESVQGFIYAHPPHSFSVVCYYGERQIVLFFLAKLQIFFEVCFVLCDHTTAILIEEKGPARTLSALDDFDG